MKKTTSIVLLAGLSAALSASGQELTGAYRVLNMPLSSHVAALGGAGISLVEDSPWAGWFNPSLYASVSDRSLGLSAMTYADGAVWAGAQYVKAFGERHTAAFHAAAMNYGEQNETDEQGTVLGQFSTSDVVIGGAYSYLLSNRWSGGAAIKGVFSSYGGYSAAAVSFDLGLNYFDPDRDLSFSLALRNVGAQISSFDGRTQRVPFSLEMGYTRGMEHTPLRFSITATDLTHWKKSDFYTPEGEGLSFGKLLLNHLVVGVDVVLSDNFYLAAGYNFRRAHELKAAGSAHGAGLTLGAGLSVRRFRFGASYAKYHVSTSSLLFDVGYTF